MLLKCSWTQDAEGTRADYSFLLMEADDTQSAAKREEMPIFLFSFVKSKSLIMLMPSQITVAVKQRLHLMQSGA